MTRPGEHVPTPEEGLMLTDDEVVAIAVDRGSFWPGALPTVSTQDGGALAEASFRGHRSLVVRGVLEGNGRLCATADHLASDIPGCRAFATVFLADDRLQRANWGLASSHYPAEDGWVLETVTPMGIHDLSIQKLDDHRRYMEALLEGARRAGPEDQQEAGEVPTAASSICILGIGAGRTIVATARRGSVQAGIATLDAGGVCDTELRSSSPRAAVAEILEAITCTQSQ